MLIWLLICYRIDPLLARHGSFNVVQKFRQRAFHLDLIKARISGDHIEQLWDEIMRIEALLRELAQREEDLTKRCRSLKPTESSQEDKNRRCMWATELEAIPRKYWFLERELYAHEVLLPQGLFLRGYNLWRSNPRWYLHPALVNDCAGSGGCCGRDCGCCEKRDAHAPGRQRGVGHCTTACGCCATNRGFDIRNPQDNAELIKMFKPARESKVNITYRRRLLRAYFFGTYYGPDAAPRWKK